MKLFSKKYNSLKNELNAIKKENKEIISNLNTELTNLRKENIQLISTLDSKIIELQEKTSEYKTTTENLHNIYEDIFGTFGWLSEKYADFHFLIDKNRIVYPNKTNAKCTETQKQFARENKELRRRNMELELILKKLELENPDYEEFIDTHSIDDIFEDEYISDEERIDILVGKDYQPQTREEKLQRALDNYISRNKSKRAIGKEYERYIGYLYEQKGYNVKFHGIEKGFEDLGIDLICTKGDETLLIQCKNWGQSKKIHENSINQLFGTAIKYKIENRGHTLFDVPSWDKYYPIFITTTQLSETAKEFAKVLGVQVEIIPFDNHYPRIKCNINRKTGDKIYHLPFDQQYDKIKIIDKGEFYAYTIEEAERLGFRKAFRWLGN